MENIAQHAVFTFGDIVISSDFDSGNLASAEEFEDNWFHLWTGPDGLGTGGENSCRTWFYFKVLTSSSVLKFTIKNLNLQGKLFRDGMKPVFKTSATDWERVPSELHTTQVNGNFELTFEHHFTAPETFFAFTYPWSYTQHLDLIQSLKSTCDSSTYYHVENMVNSLEGRACHILSISSLKGIQDSTEKSFTGLFPEKNPRCRLFANKKYVFVSSRVHPGEIPSSFVLNGFLKFITSSDPRAVLLRDLFVFKVVPILNPDGVFRGYYRTDTRGVNLNRFYASPVLSEHPTIYATRELFAYYHTLSEVYLYVDLHGHASKKGCFVYGNYLEFKEQIETCLFAKLLALNCANFDFAGSNFTESNMRARDKRDNLSKEGSGRVALYKLTGLVRCYTLECNYNTGKVVNSLVSPEDEVTDTEGGLYAEGPPRYTPAIYEDVGRAIAVSLLDYLGLNPISRVDNIAGVRLEVAAFVASMIPFRFDAGIKKASKSIEELENYFLDRSRQEVKKPPRPEKKPLASRNKSDGKRDSSIGREGYVVVAKKEVSEGERRGRSIERKEAAEEKKGNEVRQSREKGKHEGKGASVVQIKEMVFADVAKETSSQRGRSMNRRVTRKIILHSSSVVPKRIEI